MSNKISIILNRMLEVIKMWKFRIDPGTALLFLFLILYIVFAATMPYTKRNEIYGIKLRICYESEELWHKIHVNASYVTIPFIIINIICLFLKNAILKTFLAILICLLLCVTWSFVAKIIGKKYLKQKRIDEEKELKEAIKRESGWMP